MLMTNSVAAEDLFYIKTALKPSITGANIRKGENVLISSSLATRNNITHHLHIRI